MDSHEPLCPEGTQRIKAEAIKTFSSKVLNILELLLKKKISSPEGFEPTPQLAEKHIVRYDVN